MTPEFAYFLKVNVAFILLYAFYRLFFYKDTFFKLRRTILLAFFGVSLLYPLMNIQDWIREQGPIVEVIQMYSAILPETTITPGNVPPNKFGMICYFPVFLILLERCNCLIVPFFSTVEQHLVTGTAVGSDFDP